MPADEQWPFTEVRTVEHRGDLLVLTGVAPDGEQVTITRLSLAAATDQAARQRFHRAVEQLHQSGQVRLGWWDTETLSPWAATHADPRHRGADLILAHYDPELAAQPGGDAGSHGRAGAGSLVQRRLPVLLSAAGGAFVLVIVLIVGVVVAADDPSAEPSSSPSATFSYQPTPAPSTSPTSTDDPFGTGTPTTVPTQRPTLRQVEPASVYGPTWKRSDDHATMAISGLDYAFRAPSDFSCMLVGSTADTSQVRCSPLVGQDIDGRSLSFTNRTCPGDRCVRSQVELFETLLEGNSSVDWTRKDEYTRYAIDRFVDPADGRDYFRMYLSHVYPDENGDHVNYVGAVGEAPAGKHAKEIQKTVNDIYTQTG